MFALPTPPCKFMPFHRGALCSASIVPHKVALGLLSATSVNVVAQKKRLAMSDQIRLSKSELGDCLRVLLQEEMDED